MAYDQPRQTISKKDSICSKCQGQIKKNAVCFINPKTKEITHLKCSGNSTEQTIKKND